MSLKSGSSIQLNYVIPGSQNVIVIISRKQNSISWHSCDSKKKQTYFEKICLEAACNQTGMGGGHVEQDPAGMPVLPSLLG